MVFPAGGAAMIDSFDHVDKGDNNNINRWLTYSGRLAALSPARVIIFIS